MSGAAAGGPSGGGRPAFDAEVETFLALCRTMTLATADADGTPHAANVQYVHDAGWGLWWVSKPEARHSRELAARPAAAVTVYAHRDAPDQIHGLQLRGVVATAVTVRDAGFAAAFERYASKYPFVAEGALRAAVEAQAFYRFVPSWLRWIDNRRGFGFKVETTLSGE